MLNVIILSNAYYFLIIMLSIVMLNVVILSVAVLNVVMLNAGCRSALYLTRLPRKELCWFD
jgi:hypothetical protein